MTKIKVKQLTAGSGTTIFQRTESTGVYTQDIFTDAQVRLNPSRFEIVEVNATAESILRESFPEHKLGPGWVKVREPRPMQPRTSFREDASQQIAAMSHTLTARHFTPPSSIAAGSSTGAGTWKRGGISVTVADDGSYWVCGKSNGKDAHALDTLLDTEFPESACEVAEANRRRVERAYRAMGLSVEESKAAVGLEELTVAECWAKLLGSEEAADIAINAGRERLQISRATLKTWKNTRGNSR